MPTLLIVHHTPSPNTHAMFERVVEGASADPNDPRVAELRASTNVQSMFEAVVDGATTDEIEGVDVVRKPALAATPSDVLAADGYLLGTTANLGYMSGALKHFFDQVYYPCLDATKGRPYSYYVHGGSDVSGTTRGIERIVTGLGWETSAAPVTVTGEPSKEDLEACWELGATLAASLME